MQDRTSQNSPDEQPQSPGVPIPPEEVKAELQRILSSPTFRNAPRHSEFLKFVVGKALAGEAENVKEYLIGLEVFHRRSDYDPATDPIVRAEARRLRARLAEYYGTLGEHNQIRIELPKGTYVPVFARNGVETPPAETEPEPRLVKPAAGAQAPAIVPPAERFPRRWLAVAAVVLIALVAGGLYWKRSHKTTAKLTDKDSIVLGDFDNNAGDAVFDDVLKQGLSVQLEQSPFLYLVSDSNVNQALKLMGRPAGDRMTPEVTREVCLRTNSTAMLTGAIARLGSQYVIGLKAVSCNTGDVLAEAQEQAASKDEVLKALDAAAIGVRGRLGESLSSVEKYSTPLEEATTPSLEALKAYSLGQKTSSAQGGTAALPFFKRAVELDPNFARAYVSMSAVYGNLNEAGLMAESARKAYDLRARVSERERVAIEASYYTYATGELEKAAQVWELWQQTYPRDTAPYANLGFIYATEGSYEKALAENRESMRRDPNSWVSYANLAAAYTNLNCWMRRRRRTSRRTTATWKARACSRSVTRWLF